MPILKTFGWGYKAAPLFTVIIDPPSEATNRNVLVMPSGVINRPSGVAHAPSAILRIIDADCTVIGSVGTVVPNKWRVNVTRRDNNAADISWYSMLPPPTRRIAGTAALVPRNASVKPVSMIVSTIAQVFNHQNQP